MTLPPCRSNACSVIDSDFPKRVAVPFAVEQILRAGCGEEWPSLTSNSRANVSWETLGYLRILDRESLNDMGLLGVYPRTML